MSRAAFVVNPAKCPDQRQLRSRAASVMAAHGWELPLWYETTTDDPGRGQAEKAMGEGAELVFACGGDGTVTACANGLAGTGVPLAILPLGTGNLLVRNLDLPDDLDEVLLVGLTGRDRHIDLGRIDLSRTGEQRFVVMAGMGLAAEMMADASPRLKGRVGWVAYLLAFFRHIRDRGVAVQVRVDDAAPVELRARTVVIGNVGRLQAGLPLLPEAAPDDGRLDVVVLAPRSALDWLAVVAGILSRRNGHGERRLFRATGREIAVRAERPVSLQLDGEPIDAAAELAAQVEPAALSLRVPLKEKE